MYNMSLVHLRIKPGQTCQHMHTGNPTKPLMEILRCYYKNGIIIMQLLISSFITGFPRQPVFTSGQISTNIRRQQVVKYGSESKFTIGTLQLCETHARLENIDLAIEEGYGPHDMTVSNRFRMFGQYEIYSTCNEPFAKPGDSGSLVFMLRDNNEDDLVCIGMVIGTWSHGSCIVTPIEHVLRALNLPLSLSRFEDSSPVPAGAIGNSTPSNDNILQLILGSIKTLELSTKQSFDALENKFEARFISLERKVHKIKSARNESDRDNGQEINEELRTNENDADSDDSL